MERLTQTTNRQKYGQTEKWQVSLQYNTTTTFEYKTFKVNNCNNKLYTEND